MRRPLPAASKSIVAGRDLDTGQHVLLTAKARQTHLQVVGASGRGKSKFLEWLIREDILARHGLCVIDKSGHLYNDLVKWLAANHPELKRPVILFNPGDDEYVTGYNPLRRTAVDVAYRVDEMVKACARVWGAADMTTMPLLKKCLRLIFTALAERQLTLLESQYLINAQARDLRSYLTGPLAGTMLGDLWEFYNKSANPKQFFDDFASSMNRLLEFLAAPRLRRILGQTEHALDLRQIMDRGGMLLVNLSGSGRISGDNAHLLGTLLVNDLFLTATERPKGARPFYVYIDECQYFVNEDIGHLLDEARKFGVHVTLAHQHLSQLRKAGEAVYDAVRTDAQTKVIFGGLTPEDAEVLAQQVYMGEFDPNEIKLEIKRTFEHHRLEWFTVTSRTTGNTSGGQWSSGRSTPSPLFGSGIPTTTITETSGGVDSRTDAETVSEVPVLIPEEDQETSSVQFRSLEEQLYRAVATMVCQPEQQALLKVLTAKTRTIKTPNVSDPSVRPERIRRYELACYGNEPFTLPVQEADSVIEARQGLLEHQAKEHFDAKAKQNVHSKHYAEQPRGKLRPKRRLSKA